MGQLAANADVTSAACHLLKSQTPQQEAMATPLVWVDMCVMSKRTEMVEAHAQENQVAERKRLSLVATASTCKPCTNCDQNHSIQAKHQTLISAKEESSDAEPDDRHSWQVFSN